MDYTIQLDELKSGMEEAEIRRYQKVIGESGRTWLYAIQPNAGDNIYVSASPYELETDYNGFRGFSGSTLKFVLKDDSILELKAPWHSNSESLFEDTGIDLRDQHLTFVVIGLGIESDNYKETITDVIYKDSKPHVGLFEWGKLYAQELANQFKQRVVCYTRTAGGSSTEWILPKEQVNGNK